jgi:hypothetical protein
MDGFTLGYDDALRSDPRLPARRDGPSLAMELRGTPIRMSPAGGRPILAADPAVRRAR